MKRRVTCIICWEHCFSNKLDVSEKISLLDARFNLKEDEKIRKDLGDMCNLSYGILEEGIERGIERGRIETLADLVKDGILNIKDAAARLGFSEKEFEQLLKK